MNRLLIALALSALATPALAADPPTTATSDQQDVAALQTVAKDAISDGLVDPDSAEFKWPVHSAISVTDLKKGWIGRKITGVSQLLCGRVNAKNRMGGYAGYSWFWVAIQNGAVVEHDLDSGDDQYAQQTCAKFGFVSG